MNSPNSVDPLSYAVGKARTAVISVALFSCVINLLMLTGPLFMLQIYDRVLTSRSVPTLVALFLLVVALYLCLGIFEFFRSRVLSRIGYRLDVELMEPTNRMWLATGLKGTPGVLQPLNDLTVLRQFLCGNGLPALFDLPWIPIYLLVIFLLHPWLGWMATAGAIILVLVTVINELSTKELISSGVRAEALESRFSQDSKRNAGAIQSLGMIGDLTRYWSELRKAGLALSQKANARMEGFKAFNKAFRLLLQSTILALGAYLAIHQEISAGTMIAASILAGRALAPIDAAVANWKGFVRGRQAYVGLKELMKEQTGRPVPTRLPDPAGRLEVVKAVKLVPVPAEQSNPVPILNNINFTLEPGDGLGVIGPSASGKSSLARLLAGIWIPDRGSVRLDGAAFDQWESDVVGKFVGYLPQNVELFPGTIKQNIGRFSAEIDDEAVVAAAKLAGVHELVLKLPNGYDSDLSDGRTVLSGGQVQRIALARAAYGNPPLVVLDEPNSNLDADGDAALSRAIGELRKSGSCVVVMAHRPSAIVAVNKLLVLQDGAQAAFGAKG